MVIVEVLDGKYVLKLVDYVFYQGEWEVYMCENDYLVDVVVLQDFDFKKNVWFDVVFDIFFEQVIVKLSKGKEKKEKIFGKYGIFIVFWDYLNIMEGYDY